MSSAAAETLRCFYIFNNNLYSLYYQHAAVTNRQN
jgi:hypothetical protein